MTDATTENILALARKAHQGNWKFWVAPDLRTYVIVEEDGDERSYVAENLIIGPDTGIYIAAAHPAAIIAMHERHRAEVAWYKGACLCRFEPHETGKEIVVIRECEYHKDMRLRADREVSLRAEVERLTRERDEARNAALKEGIRAGEIESALAAERKRVGELGAALAGLIWCSDHGESSESIEGLTQWKGAWKRARVALAGGKP